MSDLDDIVELTIEYSSAPMDRASFDTPLLAAYHALYADRVRTYADLTEMITDGFTTASPAYMAASVLIQDPRITRWKIGRRASSPTKTLRVIPTVTTEGFVYNFNIKIGTTVTPLTYTVLASATVATICDDLVTLIDAVTGINAADGTTHVTVTAATATNLFSIYGAQFETGQLKLSDVTTDPGLAADLNAIIEIDNNWYGLLLDSNSSLEVQAAAPWARTNGKLFGYASADSACWDNASTTDIAYVLKAAAEDHVFGIWHPNELAYAAAAWMGDQFPFLPGANTWQYKTMSGLAVTSINTSKQSALKAKYMSYYVVRAGANVTMGEAKVASGRYIDGIRFIDWLRRTMQENIFSALIANGKIPMTNAGLAVIEGCITDALTQGQNNGGIDNSTGAYRVIMPDVLAIPASDRASRNATGIRWSARGAGAIHKVTMRGLITD